MFQSYETGGGSGQSTERVARLRMRLADDGLDGFIVPRADEFQGEYVAAYAERLRWLTGFSGSAGLAIVLMDAAVIFVDGRYTVQVGEQTDSAVFQALHLSDDPPGAWIARTLKPGQVLGYDPWLLTTDQTSRYTRACARAGARLQPVAVNPLDAVWDGQPARPAGAVFAHPTQLAGQSASDKLTAISVEVAASGADAAVLTMPDSIAWLFNIRGQDVIHTPVVHAFAVVTADGGAQVFIDTTKVSEHVRDHLDRVARIRPFDEFSTALDGLSNAKVRIDPANAPEFVRARLAAAGADIVNAPDPCIVPKARKNSVEQEGARQAHRRDGVAMVKFLAWFDHHAPAGGLNEIAAASALEAFRADSAQLKEISFDTISAAGAHAALPHYRVDRDSNRIIKPDTIYLVDSGGQYDDGTTDITRTVSVGLPSDEMKDRFTRVLKGMIALSRACFPAGTTGGNLDVLARQALWRAGLDFDHGTGHGVGSYLSVHEGPARFSKTDTTKLETGMILSNEPGYYKPGAYGIRIENLLLVQAPRDVGGDRPMHGFETLTLAPIDRRLIDVALLTKGERDWLDRYHARVLSEISPMLDGETRTWLEGACKPL